MEGKACHVGRSAFNVKDPALFQTRWFSQVRWRKSKLSDDWQEKQRTCIPTSKAFTFVFVPPQYTATTPQRKKKPSSANKQQADGFILSHCLICFSDFWNFDTWRSDVCQTTHEYQKTTTGEQPKILNVAAFFSSFSFFFFGGGGHLSTDNNKRLGSFANECVSILIGFTQLYRHPYKCSASLASLSRSYFTNSPASSKFFWSVEIPVPWKYYEFPTTNTQPFFFWGGGVQANCSNVPVDPPSRAYILLSVPRLSADYSIVQQSYNLYS